MEPDYWESAKKHLSRADPVLKKLIKAYPDMAISSRGDEFQTLARAIVGQQISVKAAQSVWNRVCSCLEQKITPEAVVAANRKNLRACGLSDRKTEYIADLAQHFVDGKIHARDWPRMADEEIIAELTDVRGIGRWTAEMFLMFNLLRADVFPLDDLGLQKGMRVAYFKGRKISLQRMKKLGETWRPWRSVATWYLWRSLDPVPVEY